MKSQRSSKPQHWREGVGVAQKLASAEVPRRVLYRVEEAVVLLGLSRSQLYELIRSGRLRTVVTEGRVRRQYQPRRLTPTCRC